MTQRALLMVLLTAVIVFPAAGFATTAPPPVPQLENQFSRALWVGEEAKGIVLDAQKQDQFFVFIESPHGYAPAKINRVLLNVEVFDFSSKTQKKAMRAFLTRAHNTGIQVEYLTGKEYWVKDSSGFTSAMKRADRMIAFNKGSDNISERFDGLHYDIRPYLNDGWKNNFSGGTDEYNNIYQKNYLKILTGAKEKITASGQNLTLAVDVPTWFAASAADIWVPLTASETPVSYIAVFNSFDTKETFLYGYSGANKSGGIGPNLARSGGVPMIFAGNVKQDEADSLSFAEESAGEMESVFAEAVKAFGVNPQFKGLGVMTYAAYKNLTPGTMPAASVEVIPKPEPISAPQPQPTVPAPVVISEPVAISTPVVVSKTMSNVHALWVWSEAYTVVTDAAAQAEFFTFLDAPHGDSSARINRVYLNGDGFDVNKQTVQLRAFLKKAHEKGIAVEYLTGNSKWALDGETVSAIDRCNRVENFNAGTAVVVERFDGIHLDIEPYLLSGWKDGSAGDGYNDTIEQNYLSIMKTCRSIFDKGGRGTMLSGDIPTWYSSSVADIWNVISSKDSPMHYLTVMNYFDTEVTFLYGYGGTNKSGGIGPNLAKDIGGIPMVFGAETINLDPVSITFAQEGVNALHDTLNKAFAAFDSNSSFAGVSIHHYKTYRALQK